MAITNKLITFNKLTSFETQLAQGNILETSIVFIKDAKKIWTKGTYFDCSGGGSNNIAIYETTDDVYNGVLNDNTYELSPILNNINIYTFVIKQRVKFGTYNIFVFNRCSEIEPGTNYFSCLYTNASEHILYKLSHTITNSAVTLTKQDLALKSDIPNTDDFALKSEIPDTSNLATQANLTSAVTQLTTNIAKKQDKLVSGTNIKTINSTSLLGSGNITIKDTKNLTYSLNNSTSGTVTLLPNVCIYMPNVLTGKLAINACSTISSNNADLIESRICFRMPNNAILPVIQFNGVAIRWAGGNAPTFEADFTYEVSLFYPSNANNVGPMGVCVGFK